MDFIFANISLSSLPLNGKEPLNKINREFELEEVIDSFSNDNPSSDVFILTGPRGCGKTVALTTLSEYFSKEKEFIVIELNPEMDMLEQLASKVVDAGKIRKLFIKSEFNFSFHGISLTVKGEEKLNNSSNADSTGETVEINDENVAKSDKIKKNDTSIELILYSFLVIIMLAVFVIFIMDSNKMREK